MYYLLKSSFQLKNQKLKKILENEKKICKSQGILLVRKSGNHEKCLPLELNYQDFNIVFNIVLYY